MCVQSKTRCRRLPGISTPGPGAPPPPWNGYTSPPVLDNGAYRWPSPGQCYRENSWCVMRLSKYGHSLHNSFSFFFIIFYLFYFSVFFIFFSSILFFLRSQLLLKYICLILIVCIHILTLSSGIVVCELIWINGLYLSRMRLYKFLQIYYNRLYLYRGVGRLVGL